MRSILHKAIMFFNRFKRFPKARRSAEIPPKANIHRSLITGERVKIKGDYGSFPTIHENVFLNDDVVIWCDVEIGRDSKIDAKTLLTDGQSRRGYFPDELAPVKIGERVCVGALCVISRGVTIGDDAIIEHGSVVKEDVPAKAIVAGNPAKIIGMRKDV